MRHKTNAARRQNDASSPSADDVIISVDDYVRLREIAGDSGLAEELERAIVVPSDRIQKNVVTMHSRVVYRDENTGATREVELVYPDEADPLSGRVSVLAPVGCALLGQTAGQSFDCDLPSGKVHRLCVERVLFQPQYGSPVPAVVGAV